MWHHSSPLIPFCDCCSPLPLCFTQASTFLLCPNSQPLPSTPMSLRWTVSVHVLPKRALTETNKTSEQNFNIFRHHLSPTWPQAFSWNPLLLSREYISTYILSSFTNSISRHLSCTSCLDLPSQQIFTLPGHFHLQLTSWLFSHSTGNLSQIPLPSQLFPYFLLPIAETLSRLWISVLFSLSSLQSDPPASLHENGISSVLLSVRCTVGSWAFSYSLHHLYLEWLGPLFSFRNSLRVVFRSPPMLHLSPAHRPPLLACLCLVLLPASLMCPRPSPWTSSLCYRHSLPWSSYQCHGFPCYLLCGQVPIFISLARPLSYTTWRPLDIHRCLVLLICSTGHDRINLKKSHSSSCPGHNL